MQYLQLINIVLLLLCVVLPVQYQHFTLEKAQNIVANACCQTLKLSPNVPMDDLAD